MGGEDIEVILLPCADRLAFIAGLSQKPTSYYISQQKVIGGMERKQDLRETKREISINKSNKNILWRTSLKLSSQKILAHPKC